MRRILYDTQSTDNHATRQGTWTLSKSTQSGFSVLCAQLGFGVFCARGRPGPKGELRPQGGVAKEASLH